MLETDVHITKDEIRGGQRIEDGGDGISREARG
jgi:hypothetical protein